MQGQFIQDGKHIDYTPGSAVDAGDVVFIAAIAGVAPRDIAANTLGSLTIAGVHRIAKATAAINAGADVYWDADGDPVGGTAGSGAATATSTGNTLMGKAVAAAGSGTSHVDVLLNNNPA